ncbi:MAG: spore germination protein, partial [Traorella sp.]
CEVLYGKTLNPYPHVRYSERPDICSIHLLQGNIVILVDNMPSSMILPTTFFEQIQQIEEYTQTPMIAFMTRFIRLSGIFMSLYILPFILICIFENKWVESSIEIDSIAFLTFQILICELLIEWIRQSLLYAPNLINSILGFIVAFVLGDFGIDLGAYSKDILLLVALSNLGNFLTPSYEIALANKFMRIFMTLMTIFFKLPGFIIGVMIHLYLLCTTKTLKHPYLYPLIPFDLKEMKRLLFDTNIYTK